MRRGADLATSNSVTIIYSVQDGSLARKEGRSTFAKVKNADRQDWYI